MTDDFFARLARAQSALAGSIGKDDLKRFADIARHMNAGIKLSNERQFHEAADEFEAAIGHCPTLAEAWYFRGLVLEALGSVENAYESIAQAVILTPLYVEPRMHLRRIAAVVERAEEVVTPWIDRPAPAALVKWLRKAWARSSSRADYATADPSEEIIRAKLNRDPRSPRLAESMGRILLRQGRLAEAECFFRYALAMEPWAADAACRLCVVLERLERFRDARDVALHSLQDGASDERLAVAAFWNALAIADWTDFEQRRNNARAALRAFPASAGPLVSLYITDDPELQQRASQAYAAVNTVGCVPMSLPSRTGGSRPIVLGYLSADFREHPVAYLVAELFELHDRARFRVYGYGSWIGERAGAIGKRIRGSFDKFVDLNGIRPTESAERIASDGVDILIDLTGHTASGQPRILARRPAPLQVNFLGYPGTLGMKEVDYAVVDQTVVPTEQQRFFNEALILLPDCYQINDRKRAISGVRADRARFGLPAAEVVYCNFNEVRKITPEEFDSWMRILARVPRSVLWLLSSGQDVTINLRSEAARRGIDPARLLFAGRMPNAEHLARYALADLFLDSFAYNAHSTASDALWAGCPVLSLIGRTFPARVAASILRAAQLPEMVATSRPDYEDLAVRIGLDGQFRQTLKSKLAAVRPSCPLFDSPRFTKNLEWAFERIWDAHGRGERPALLIVPDEAAR